MDEKLSVKMINTYSDFREEVRHKAQLISPVDIAKLRYLEDISLTLAMIYDELRGKNE